MNTNEVVRKKGLGIQTMAKIGVLAAISGVLMYFEFPLPFAPPFYEIDFSEVPVLVGTFAMGPMAGVFIELIKILIKLALKGSMTAGVGEVANFCIGCAFILPAGILYRQKKTKKHAIMGLGLGVFCMTVAGSLLNAFVLLPTYARAFGMPIEVLVEMGTKVNEHIQSLTTFILFAVVPFNLFKGILISLVVILLYKKISLILRME